MEVGIIKLDHHAAKTQLEEMQATISKLGIKSILWMFSKNMRNDLQGLLVHEPSIKMVKNLLNERKKVILMPLCKSFADVYI